jgi:hypothetical protein
MIIAIISGLIFANNTIAQNCEVKSAKRKAKLSKEQLEYVHFTFERKRPKANQRRHKPKGFASTTQPFVDGLRKKGSSSKRNVSKAKSRVNMEDGVFLPGFRSKNTRKQKSNK